MRLVHRAADVSIRVIGTITSVNSNAMSSSRRRGKETWAVQ
jgi:hypothetical protein